MARPERNTVDYFPHYISDGKKMFFIEHKYGNDGYASWYKILESLSSTEFHYLDLKNDSDLMYLSAKCRIDEIKLIQIIDDLVKLGEFNPILWREKILFSEKFIESINDAYARRNNKCITLYGLCKHLLSLCRISNTETKIIDEKKDINTQSKVEYNKPKETKEDETKEILLEKETKKIEKGKSLNLNPKIKDIEERRLEFNESLKPFFVQYGFQMMESFYNYWAELTMDKKKMRFEIQKTWETNLRLATWSKNNIKFNNNGTKQPISSETTGRKLTIDERLLESHRKFSDFVDESVNRNTT